MIRWVSVEQQAYGVLAIGQEATGVIAIGQMATGVIAVGQIARGFVAIGQGAIGVFALGMGSVGLVYAVGMVGVGGMGLGLVLPLVPSLGPRLAVPETVSPAKLRSSGRPGHIEAVLTGSASGPVLRAKGSVIAARFDARLRAAVTEAGERRVYAHLSPTPEGWLCDALIDVPPARWRTPGWWAVWAVQLVALGFFAVLFWVLAGIPVVQALFNPGGILTS